MRVFPAHAVVCICQEVNEWRQRSTDGVVWSTVPLSGGSLVDDVTSSDPDLQFLSYRTFSFVRDRLFVVDSLILIRTEIVHSLSFSSVPTHPPTSSPAVQSERPMKNDPFQFPTRKSDQQEYVSKAAATAAAATAAAMSTEEDASSSSTAVNTTTNSNNNKYTAFDEEEYQREELPPNLMEHLWLKIKANPVITGGTFVLQSCCSCDVCDVLPPWSSLWSSSSPSPRHPPEQLPNQPGIVATCTAMGFMIHARNDKAKLNRYGRWRINLQTLTLLAVIHAMYKDERAKQQSPYPWDWSRPGPARYR